MTIKLGDGTLLTPQGLSSIKLGDGTVLWQAGAPPTDPNVLFSDDFNRADGAIGATDWPNNNWNINASGQAVSNSGFNPIYNSTLLPVDSYVEVDVVNQDSNEFFGLCLRANPNTGGYGGTLYYAQLASNGQWGLAKYVGGSYTNLTVRELDFNFAAWSFPFSGRVRLELFDDLLILSINGVPHKMAFVGEIAAAGYSGMLGNTDVTVDNYEAGASDGWDIDEDFLTYPVGLGLPAPWVQTASSWEIDANGVKRRPSGADFAYYDQDLGSIDQIVEVDVYDAQGGGADFIVANARHNGSLASPTCYQGFWSASNGEFTIAKMVNGVYTYIGSVAGPAAPFSGRLTLIVTGTGTEAWQELWVNGVDIGLNTYDQSISAGTYAGINAGADDRYFQGFRAKAL